jgi:ABC transport system ATP-binding/permease protein
MLVISVMLSMVFCGGMIPVTGRPILDQLSRAVPARWGFAAKASTTDLRAIAPLTPQNETLWSHHPGGWLVNMTLLIAIGAVLAGCIRWRTRLPVTHQPPQRQTTMVACTSATHADAAPAAQA